MIFSSHIIHFVEILRRINIRFPIEIRPSILMNWLSVVDDILSSMSERCIITRNSRPQQYWSVLVKSANHLIRMATENISIGPIFSAIRGHGNISPYLRLVSYFCMKFSPDGHRICLYWSPLSCKRLGNSNSRMLDSLNSIPPSPPKYQSTLQFSASVSDGYSLH